MLSLPYLINYKYSMVDDTVIEVIWLFINKISVF